MADSREVSAKKEEREGFFGQEEDEPQARFLYSPAKMPVDHALVAVWKLQGHLQGFPNIEPDEYFEIAELLWAIFLYLLTLGLQWVFIISWWYFALEEWEDPYEEGYYKEIKRALLNATTLNMSLSTAGTPRAMLGLAQCNLGAAAPPLLRFLMLFLFVGVLMSKLSDAVLRTYIILFRIKISDTDKHGEKMDKSDFNTDPPPGERSVRIQIDEYTRCGQIFCLIFLAIEIAFGLFMLWCGSKYVALQPSINYLVKANLKAMFFAKLDKIILPCFVSYNWEDFLKQSQYKTDDPVTGIWDGPLRTILLVAAGTLWSYFTLFSDITPMTNTYYHVHEYTYICRDYFDMFPYDWVVPGRPPISVLEVNSVLREHWFYPMFGNRSL